MSRVLIVARIDGGDVAQLYPTMDLSVEEWAAFFMPLAELISAAHPEAEWTATPIPDDWSDKRAISGH